MSSSNAEPFEVCARAVYGTPRLLPGVTEPGAGDVVLREKCDQQIPAGDRAGECDGGRQGPRPGRECRPLDEGRGGRLAEGRACKESCEGSNRGKTSTGEGRRQMFHGNSLLYKSENGAGWNLCGIR